MKDSQMDFVCPAPVAAARAGGSPLVALESTLISHGLPHPENIEVARGAEAAVRAAGAEPATTAVVDGRPHVGLEADVMERLATASGVEKAVAAQPSGRAVGRRHAPRRSARQRCRQP
ncbi:MAG: hypothetical protein CM15mP115_16390 [Alphaproteobacteria bacterium]|nr:MAG: hypothetical protein CM15mP115_16390 [Alphaproteobacteria bacterium]